jgi:rhodanese-related sulfurtransferase
VRSRRALGVTEFFTPDAYDAVIELADDDAYAMCRRLFTEESLTPGPSSGLALAGALRAVPDEPDVVAVVIFPDHAFKYTSSFRKHLPDLFPVAATAAPVRPANPYAIHLQHAVAMAKAGPDVVDVAEAKRLIDDGAVLVDVREPREVAQVSIDGSVLLPLPQLSEGSLAGVPVDHDTPIVTICASGVRSLYAQLLLKAQGYSTVKNVDGGIAAWIGAGLPTVQPGQTVGAQAVG